MSPRRVSAGLLPYSWVGGELRVFLGHMGGPFFAKPGARGWTVIKGEYDAAQETPREAAEREWREETGTPVPAGDWVDLGSVAQKGGKVVTAFGIEVTDPAAVHPVSSSEVRMMWPPRSDRWITFPEIDEGRWWAPDDVRPHLVQAQGELLDRLVALCDRQV